MRVPMQVTELPSADAVDDRVRAGWDALAVAQGAPGALSEWALAAQRIADPGHGARILVAHDDAGVAGVLPLRIRRWRGPGNVREYDLMESVLGARTAILARPGSETVVAGALGPALARLLATSPSQVSLARLDADSPWPGLLRARWPGRTQLIAAAPRDAPVVEIDADGDAER